MPLISAIESLAFARELSQIQEIVRITARALTGADGATFIVREQDYCHYLDEDAVSPLWKGMRFPLGECISGWCMVHREAAVIPDIYADSRIPVDIYRPTFVKSMLMVPVRSLDPIGAIGIYWARRHRATEEEVRALKGLADATALAMENVLAYCELEDRVHERTRELVAARETAQHALEAVELANLTKNRFLATATHDLRQPLQALSLLNGSLREMVHAPDVMDLVERQELAIGSSSRLVNTLLDMSKLESGSVRPVIKDFDIAGLANELRKEFADLADAKGLVLKVEADGAIVRSDPVLVEEILGNLLSNAIKYTPDGSVTLRAMAAGSTLSVRVIDTGIGISDQHMEHIFEEFYRVEEPRHGARDGYGLGLSIVERMVKLLDLKLDVHSEPGNGSVFALELPLSNT